MESFEEWEQKLSEGILKYNFSCSACPYKGYERRFKCIGCRESYICCKCAYKQSYCTKCEEICIENMSKKSEKESNNSNKESDNSEKESNNSNKESDNSEKESDNSNKESDNSYEESDDESHHCKQCNTFDWDGDGGYCNVCRSFLCCGCWQNGDYIGCEYEENVACTDCFEETSDEDKFCDEGSCDCDNKSPEEMEQRDKKRELSIKLQFGKYRGKWLCELGDEDYIKWLASCSPEHKWFKKVDLLQ